VSRPPASASARPGRALQGLVLAMLTVSLLGSGCRTAPKPFPPPESVSAGRLPSLADVFYQRLANRRFNSIATFHDPALREFFATGEAFADYYADLAQALDGERFEANRPLDIVLVEFEQTEPGRVRIYVHFSGDNARPLRWWRSHLWRADQWELQGDQWLIIPGKL
jgi:hypothetical protein